MLKIKGVRAPADQRHQGNKTNDIKYSSTPSRMIWRKNHAEFELGSPMCARVEAIST